MIGTTELIIGGVILFLLFGGAIFTRFLKQIMSAKKEVTKAVSEWDEKPKVDEKEPNSSN